MTSVSPPGQRMDCIGDVRILSALMVCEVARACRVPAYYRALKPGDPAGDPNQPHLEPLLGQLPLLSPMTGRKVGHRSQIPTGEL